MANTNEDIPSLHREAITVQTLILTYTYSSGPERVLLESILLKRNSRLSGPMPSSNNPKHSVTNFLFFLSSSLRNPANYSFCDCKCSSAQRVISRNTILQAKS